MNLKRILIIYLSIFVFAGSVSAQSEEELDAYNLVTHLLGGGKNPIIAGWLNKYCDNNISAPDCEADIWLDNLTGNFTFPVFKKFSVQVKSELITALKSVLLGDKAMKKNFWDLGYCQNGYSGSSTTGVTVTISAKVFGSVCDELGYSPLKNTWETEALSNLILNETNLGKSVESNCKSYCDGDIATCAGGDWSLPRTWAGMQCVHDYLESHPEESFPFLLKNQDKILPYGGTPLIPIPVVGAVCQKHCTKSACNLDYKQNDCMALCCEISHGTGATTDYLAECESLDPGPPTNLCKNFLQTQQWKRSLQGNHQSKANVKAAHPLVLPQNNKALRGNAPQAVKPRGVSPPVRGGASTGPRVMPPVNQGKNAPQQKHPGVANTNPQHPGMMHVDPHHPALMPPVNQGKNAPKPQHPGMMHVDPHHPSMVPLENRGRTTPPKVMNVTPPHSGMVPIQNQGMQTLQPPHHNP